MDPPDFAHGFCAIELDTVICYRVTDYHNAECDKGLRWDDPATGIEWPDGADADTLSSKDRQQALLADLPEFSLGANDSMRVIVTGGACFIGSALVRYLVVERGYNVLTVDALTYVGYEASLSAVDGWEPSLPQG